MNIIKRKYKNILNSMWMIYNFVLIYFGIEGTIQYYVGGISIFLYIMMFSKLNKIENAYKESIVNVDYPTIEESKIEKFTNINIIISAIVVITHLYQYGFFNQF